MIQRLLSRPNVAYIHDIVMAALSFGVSLYLRLGDGIFFYSPDRMVQAGLLFTVICAVVFRYTGLYRGVWRYASIADLWAITRAVSIAVLIFSFVMFLWVRLETLPRSLLVINWFVLMALLGGPRFFYRLLKDRRVDFSTDAANGQRIPVLLAGAGDGAELFIRSLARADDASYRVVGIVSERAGRVGREIHGVPVMGTFDELDQVVKELRGGGHAPQRLILTKDDLDGSQVRVLLDWADANGMTLARLPRLTDFRHGIADSVEVRPVAVEDLLGRAQTPLDRSSMRGLIKDRRVLITGAGGSIGSELVRQACEFGPTEITLVDNSEYALYTIDAEVAEHHPQLVRRAVIADVRDRDRVGRMMHEVRPELVFHAAALKHVPLVEENVLEGVMTNVIGTANVADACVLSDVGSMVLISTDKAVNPTSVMGATKRMAEIYCQALDVEGGRDGRTAFVTVRFGNVLGSTGSVVPLFQKQLAAGGPLTVTDPDMTRYFMTVREAVELVLQASALGGKRGGGDGGGEGKIYVLDMGEPVRILDLARQMVRLAGLQPDEDIRIEIIGRRPGEKLFEEVLHGGESLVPTACEGILLAAPRSADLAVIRRAISDLQAARDDADRENALKIVREFVPEYDDDAEKAPQAASG